MRMGVDAVGFDLDGTFYRSISSMDDRIRDRIAACMLERRADLGSVEKARALFEERYAILHGGKAVLQELGFGDAPLIMEEALSTADICDLIEPNQNIGFILQRVARRHRETYLVTSSGEDRALKILDKIGIDPDVFNYKVYRDNTSSISGKKSGAAFRHVLSISSVPASRHLYIGNNESSDILPPKLLGMKAASVWEKIESADYHFPTINGIEVLAA